MSFHPCKALMALSLSIASLHGQAVVLQGSSFGATAEAGGVKAGGWYQSDATASSGSAQADSEAYAWGATDIFSVHAYAWTSENPDLPSYCTVYTCSWQTYASVSVWDTVVITPSANSTEKLDYAFTINGYKKRGPWAYGDGATAMSSYYVGTTKDAWYRPTTTYLTNQPIKVTGRAEARNGEPITLYVFSELSVSARSGGMADYSQSMHFHWNLPEGWTYTSSSGRFSAAPMPVPEPASTALMLCGLFGMAALERRRVHAWLWSRFSSRLWAGRRDPQSELSRPASS
jgi:hypothetical protein